MELNAAHVHLMLNHVPILGFAIGLGLLGWGRWRGSQETVRAALALFLVVGLASILVFFSGESAEDVVEGIAGVSHDAIEVHEETGELAMIVSVIVGVLSGGALWRYRATPMPGGVALAAAVAGLAAFGLLSYAGFQGGQIHHQEIRPATSAVSAPAPHGSAPYASAPYAPTPDGSTLHASTRDVSSRSPTGAPLVARANRHAETHRLTPP